jgi:hypothetical protein
MKMPFYKLGLVVTILLTILLVAGCTQTQIPAEPENESAGSSQTIGQQPVRISYQEGLLSAGDALRTTASGPSPAFPVYFAQGKQIDSDGNAEQWIFGIRKDGENFFIVVNPDSHILQAYPVDLPGKEITSSSVIDPALLIGNNRQLFSDAGAKEPFLLPELELSEGFYTVTVSTGSGNTVMLFNATTGNPID